MSIGVDSAVGRALHMAVELEDSSGRLIWIDLTDRGFGAVALHSAELSDAVMRIRALDLGTAQREYQAIRSVAVAAGRDPDSLRILVDVAAMIDVDARSARKKLMKSDSDRAGPRERESLEYVGTASGLAGLISDICVAGVADGVTIQPLQPDVCHGLVEQTVPILIASGAFSLSDRALTAVMALAVRSPQLRT